MGFKTFEKVLLIICAVAILCKLIHLPYAFTFCFWFLASLSLSYLVAGWYLFAVVEDGKKQNKIAGSILAGFILCLLVLGIMFKLFSWDNCGPLLNVGFIFSVILFCSSLFARRKSELKKYYTVMMIRTGLIIIVGILIIPIPVKHYSYTKEGLRTRIIISPDGTRKKFIDTTDSK